MTARMSPLQLPFFVSRTGGNCCRTACIARSTNVAASVSLCWCAGCGALMWSFVSGTKSSVCVSLKKNVEPSHPHLFLMAGEREREKEGEKEREGETKRDRMGHHKNNVSKKLSTQDEIGRIRLLLAHTGCGVAGAGWSCSARAKRRRGGVLGSTTAVAARAEVVADRRAKAARRREETQPEVAVTMSWAGRRARIPGQVEAAARERP